LGGRKGGFVGEGRKFEMDDLEQLFERLKRNEEISRKFFEVEVSILSILNFKDLFERLLTEIRDKFKIPYVWIVLADGHEAAHMAGELCASELLSNRMKIVERDTLLGLMGDHGRPLLVNRDLTVFYRLFPGRESYLVRSMAIVPLTLEGRIIGTLNLGDPSENRYAPGMDPSLLERLAVKVSICLSNVMAHERLKIAASRDPLTGLLNRRAMESVLKREFERAVRYETPLAVIFLDLDDFKSVNDTYGHDAGDDLLEHLAENLCRMSRSMDVVARYAGDEFVIVLPSTPAAAAGKFADRLCVFLEKNPLSLRGEPVRVSTSYGIASIDEAGVSDPASLLRRADERLMEAKGRKRRQRRVVRLER